MLELGAAELGRAIADRRIRAEAAMQAALERARQAHERLNCVLRLDADAALAAARRADEEISQGRRRGPLHGVPMMHKDMYYREGVASSGGSKILRERKAPRTATVLERLDAAGALQFGVLNMAEFAYGPTGHNYHYGHCRNPWDAARITGGSSSGSGAAVAARACAVALGSDTGGSIRLPATFCGVVGLKPTYGRVSRAGAMPLSFSLDTVGPLARTVEDCALVLQAIAGADPADPTCSRRAVPGYSAFLEKPVAGLRIAVSKRYFYDDIDPEIAALMQASVEQLARLGARIVQLDLPEAEEWSQGCLRVIGPESAACHAQWLRARPQDYSEQVRSRLEQASDVPVVEYINALRGRAAALKRFCQRVFSQADLFHAPVVAFQTPTIAETDVGGGGAMTATLRRITRLTRPWNYLGVPTLAVPAGFTRAGMPTCMQLVGRPFGEGLLFAAGHAYQQATDWHRRAPAL